MNPIPWLYLLTLCVAFVGINRLFDELAKQRAVKVLEQRMAETERETVPGVREYWWVEEHGALHFQDRGQGAVDIGFAGIDGDGRWVYNPEKRGRAWFDIRAWRGQGNDITVVDQMIAKMKIGDEVVFGGYRLKLMEIRYGGGQYYWACLEVTPADEAPSARP